MSRRKDRINGFLIGLFIGGLAGTSAAMLYTPMSGKKMRKKIARTKEDLVEDVNEYVHNSRDFIKDKKKKAEELFGQAKSMVSHRST